jgi:hypothetical protein
MSAEIYLLDDSKAKTCLHCGSVGWVLLKSGKIECKLCGSIIINAKWGLTLTNREAHEAAAGMGIDTGFFVFNGIDPDAEFTPEDEEQARRDNVHIQWMTERGHTLHCAQRLTWGDGVCECGRDKSC